MAWGEIDDEAIEAAGELIGVPLRRERLQWVQQATRDAIRHFVWGIGDNNPLALDDEYAAGTRWGGIIAPPCFLYAVDYTVVAPKLPGVQWIYAGTDWTWFDAVRLDDKFGVRAALTGQRQMSGKTFSRWVLQDSEIEYRTGSGNLVARALGHCARTPRSRVKAHSTPEGGASEQQYTPEQLSAIDEQALSEAPAGAKTRYWEDVEIGELVPSVVKGPLSIVDIVAWYSATQGAQPYGGVHADALRYRARHQDFHINEKTGAKDSAGRGHLEAQTGKDVGMGGAYDVGPQRIAWAGQMLSYWLGDDGFLHKLNVEVRRPNLVGDTTWWHGKVTATWQADGRSFVRIGVWAVNQRDVRTAWGHAVVMLPSRERGPVDLPLLHDYDLPAGQTDESL
jgi:acyl dehydratase